MCVNCLSFCPAKICIRRFISDFVNFWGEDGNIKKYFIISALKFFLLITFFLFLKVTYVTFDMSFTPLHSTTPTNKKKFIYYLQNARTSLFFINEKSFLKHFMFSGMWFLKIFFNERIPRNKKWLRNTALNIRKSNSVCLCLLFPPIEMQVLKNLYLLLLILLHIL